MFRSNFEVGIGRPAPSKIFHYSYRNQAESVEDIKAVFPNFEDRILFNVNFSYFDLDFSVRECSITSPLKSYDEMCVRYEKRRKITI